MRRSISAYLDLRARRASVCARSFVIFALLVSISACNRFKPPVIPEGDTLELSSKDQEAAFRVLREGNHALTSYRSFSKGTVKKALGQQSFSLSVAFIRPDRLRIELFATTLNRLLAMCVVNGDLLRAVDTENRTVFEGVPTQEAIERFFSLPFHPLELMSWASGEVVVPDVSNVLEQDVTATLESGRRYNFILRDGRSLRMRTAPKSNTRLHFLKIERPDTEEVLLVSQFIWDEADPKKLHAIRSWFPTRETFAELRLEDEERNPDFQERQDRMFSAGVPVGYTLRDFYGQEILMFPKPLE